LHSKTSKFLAVLIVFFASTQLGYHFWPLSSLVYGIRIDYLSPTIYFLDLLIILYLFPQLQSLQGFRRVFTVFAIVPILLTNLLFSQNSLATLSWSLHLILYLLFFSFLRLNPQKGILKIILTLTLLFQLVLSLAQVYLGHNLGGLMYYLGERNVAVGQPSVALGSFMDHVVLRAYGTFGHPNVLAGWLVITLLILLRLSPQLQSFAIVVLVSLGVLLTQSRSAVISLFGIIIPFYIFKSLKSRILYFVVLMVTGSLITISISRPISSSSERLDLQGLSSQVIKNYPLFGTGAQASISTYPMVSLSARLLQPDHNSLTLFLSWFGLFGVLALLSQLQILQGARRVFGTFAPLIPLLLLDHYFLTSPQGLFIILLYYSHVQKDRE